MDLVMIIEVVARVIFIGLYCLYDFVFMERFERVGEFGGVYFREVLVEI